MSAASSVLAVTFGIALFLQLVWHLYFRLRRCAHGIAGVLRNVADILDPPRNPSAASGDWRSGNNKWNASW